MLDFLGVTEHFSCIENTPFSFPALFRDMVGEAVSVDGVIFSGSIVSANKEVLEIVIEKGEASNEVILSFPALPEGRWSYSVLVQGDDGSQRILFSGYISVLGVSRAEELVSGTPMKNRTLLVAMPGEATTRLRMEWLATTAAQAFAAHALQFSKQTHADADTASQAATTATDAASTATERTKEAEGYAESAHASEMAAGNSASAASTSAAEAARDAKTASDARAEVEGIASTWPQTVSNAEQTISAAKEEAVTAIQGKQSDSVLAVGRASQTAQQSVASAQSAAVAAVETAETEAVQAVKTAQATAESSIGGMVHEATDASSAAQTARSEAESAAGRAGTSATSAASSAAAAQQALSAIPQVDAAGNMTLTGALTTAAAINANGGVNIPVAPSTDTEAARYREVRLLHEMEFSALRTYFSSSNPFSWGILVDRFWWAAGRDNMPAWTVVTADFNMLNLDNNNTAYDGLTSCYFPMSCGLGYGRCFDSIAIGNTSFNADYASLDDDPFATPAGYMRYWVDIQIGRPANGQCAVSVRMSRWDNASSTAVNTTHQCSVPDSLALRGVALSMTSKHSGVWLVGFNKSAGRLVSYKVLPETFTLDSYNRAMSSRLSLAKTAGHCSVGVHAPCYYGGTVVGEWCSLIQAN